MRSAVAKEDPPNFITILTTPSSGSLISISSLLVSGKEKEKYKILMWSNYCIEKRYNVSIFYPTVAKLVARTDNLKLFLEILSLFLKAAEVCILLNEVTLLGVENNKPDTAEYEICNSNMLRTNQETIILLISVIVSLKIWKTFQMIQTNKSLHVLSCTTTQPRLFCTHSKSSRFSF